MHGISYNNLKRFAKTQQTFEEANKMYIDQEKQFSFTSGWFEVPQLDENDELVKISKVIDWDSLTEKLAKFYHPSLGRHTKPARVKVGLMILKHLYQLADRETVKELKQNMYAQYLCDINPRDAHSFIDHSTLCYFRKDIGVEGVKIIEYEVFCVLKKLNLLKGKKSKRLVVDTTVVPSPIQYPTDINHLEKSRRQLLKLLDIAKSLGAKSYRTYKRVAKKAYLKYQKLRRVSKNIRRKTQKKLLQFSQRNLKQLMDAICDIQHSQLDKIKEQFLKNAQSKTKIIEKILQQQKEIYKGNSVKDRIVSLWANHIRPMVRGKYPIEVEFGPKVLLSKISDFLFFNRLFFDNVSDVNLLSPSIDDYKKKFKDVPSELATDRGFYSKENVAFANSVGIKNIAIEKKGKSSSSDKSPPFLKRLRRLRCAIEAKISLSKRKYGLNRINYRIPNGEEIWIRMGLLTMNLKKAMDYG